MHESDITCPAFLALDRSIINDFLDCTEDSTVEIEACIRALSLGEDGDCINRLFRALHSLKGNCQMVGLTDFVEPLHLIEELVSRFRTQQWVYHPKVGDFLIRVSDGINELLRQLVSHGSAPGHFLSSICDTSAHLLAHTTAANVAQQFVSAGERFGKSSLSRLPDGRHHRVSLELPADMELMHSFSTRLDELSIYRKNRGEQVVKLSAQLNLALGTPVDPEQLKAASLMHDIGMGFIPHNIFNREGSLSKEELRKLQEHVIIGGQILMRFGNWEDAALMVVDHHERFDGSGYPNGTAGEKIHPGGHILSIVDTFCAITTERSDRAFKKSLLSAISEINANSESQFHPDMVKAFTGVVRNMMMGNV